mmetsp:Transcript_43964/g.113590  ORF Transcript_43964/g.113590 Transcript_43964/m.113590 type:complete len:252 (+) Transcript_43964:85-840(+)
MHTHRRWVERLAVKQKLSRPRCSAAGGGAQGGNAASHRGGVGRGTSVTLILQWRQEGIEPIAALPGRPMRAGEKLRPLLRCGQGVRPFVPPDRLLAHKGERILLDHPCTARSSDSRDDIILVRDRLVNQLRPLNVLIVVGGWVMGELHEQEAGPSRRPIGGSVLLWRWQRSGCFRRPDGLPCRRTTERCSFLRHGGRWRHHQLVSGLLIATCPAELRLHVQLQEARVRQMKLVRDGLQHLPPTARLTQPGR